MFCVIVMIQHAHVYYIFRYHSNTDNDARLQALWQAAQKLPKANRHNLRYTHSYSAIPYSGNVWHRESLANLANRLCFAKL